MPSFEVTFRFAGSFDGAPPIGSRQRKRPLVLLGESDALRELHGMLGASMEKNGLQTVQNLVPHMTLFYGPDAISFQPIEPIRLMVYEFVLIHSERGLTRYNILGRWPLRH